MKGGDFCGFTAAGAVMQCKRRGRGRVAEDAKPATYLPLYPRHLARAQTHTRDSLQRAQQHPPPPEKKHSGGSLFHGVLYLGGRGLPVLDPVTVVPHVESVYLTCAQGAQCFRQRWELLVFLGKSDS